MIVTRAPYQIYITLTLYHIAQSQPIWFLQIFNSYNWSSFLFHSLKYSPHISSPFTYGILRNCFSYPVTLKLFQDRDQSTKTQCFVPPAPEKLTEGHSRIWHPPAPTRIVVHVVIKPVTFYQSTKLVMRKILVVLSSGNVRNIALESPKLLYHLLQSMNKQIDPLLLENLAPFAWIISAPVILIWLIIARIHLAVMFATLQPRAADSYTPEEMQGHALLPPEFGTVISTQQLHQQLHILHHQLATRLHVRLHLH